MNKFLPNDLSTGSARHEARHDVIYAKARNRAKGKLALLGEERFSCTQLAVKSMRRVDCAGRFIMFTPAKARAVDARNKNGYGQAARVGTKCTRCPIGEAHSRGERPQGA